MQYKGQYSLCVCVYVTSASSATVWYCKSNVCSFTVMLYAKDCNCYNTLPPPPHTNALHILRRAWVNSFLLRNCMPLTTTHWGWMLSLSARWVCCGTHRSGGRSVTPFMGTLSFYCCFSVSNLWRGDHFSSALPHICAQFTAGFTRWTGWMHVQ